MTDYGPNLPPDSTPEQLLADRACRLRGNYIELARWNLVAESQPTGLSDEQLEAEGVVEERIDAIYDEVPLRLGLAKEAARITTEAVIRQDREEPITPEEQQTLALANMFVRAYIADQDRRK